MGGLSHKWSKTHRDNLLEGTESWHQQLQNLETHLSNPDLKL